MLDRNFEIDRDNATIIVPVRQEKCRTCYPAQLRFGKSGRRRTGRNLFHRSPLGSLCKQVADQSGRITIRKANVRLFNSDRIRNTPSN